MGITNYGPADEFKRDIADIRHRLKMLEVTPLVNGVLSSCNVGRVATLSTSTSTWTDVTWTSEAWKTDATMHDTGTNPQRFIVPTGLDGKWMIVATLQWAVAAAGTSRFVGVTKNGGAVFNLGGVTTATTAPTVSVSRVMSLAAGDYITVQAWQDSGGALDVGTACEASFVRISN